MKSSFRTAASLTAALAAASLAGGGERPAAAGESKIAVVDVQHVLEGTEEGMRARGILKKEFDKAQLEIDNRQTELRKEQDDIEKQSRVLSREAMQRRMETWQ